MIQKIGMQLPAPLQIDPVNPVNPVEQLGLPGTQPAQNPPSSQVPTKPVVDPKTGESWWLSKQKAFFNGQSTELYVRSDNGKNSFSILDPSSNQIRKVGSQGKELGVTPSLQTRKQIETALASGNLGKGTGGFAVPPGEGGSLPNPFLLAVKPTPAVKQSFDDKYVAQREAYADSIRDFPPIVKELAGVAGGFWFETLGKLGIGAKELIDTIQAMAKQITASPAAWKTFIDSNFSGNDPDARLYRKLLEGGLPKGGAGDGKTTMALLLALDRKVGILSNKLENALLTNPVGVGQKLLAGLKQMVKQELSDLNINKHSDVGVYLGTLLAKVVFGVIPLAKGGIAGAKAMKLAVATNAPKLLKAMGKAGFEGAVASVKLADAKLLALAKKAKLPGGLSAAEKVQKTALTSQLKNAAKAASGNDAKGLQDASAALDKTLRKKTPVATGDSNLPRPKNNLDDPFYKIPHKDGRKFLAKSGFVEDGQPPAHFAKGNTFGLDIGDRLFNSPLEADAALARFIARKPTGEYSIRTFEVKHGNPMTTKYLVSIEPSEMKHLITIEAQNRQIRRVRDWGIANEVDVKLTRFDHNHPTQRGNLTKTAIPSGAQSANSRGDIQAFLESSISRRGDKFGIWAQDSKTVVKLEFTVKASPLDKNLGRLGGIEDRALFSKLFNDCFDVKIQKFDHRGNKIGPSKPFDVMKAISKEGRTNATLELSATAILTGLNLYLAKVLLDSKDKNKR